MTVKLRHLFRTCRTMHAIEHAQTFGADREAVERRYREARAAYIEASNDLARFGVRYEELVAEVPDSIDLSGHSGTRREPIKPRIVKSNGLDVER